MSLGVCQFFTCRSSLGSGFRAQFVHGADPDAYTSLREVLLCSEHEQLCRPIRDQGSGQLFISPEGHVYTSFLFDSILSK